MAKENWRRLQGKTVSCIKRKWECRRKPHGKSINYDLMASYNSRPIVYNQNLRHTFVRYINLTLISVAENLKKCNWK